MASDHRIPQLGTAVGLEQVVLEELLQIHARGLNSRSNPSATPFIAELALGEDGEASTYSEAVEELLHFALSQMSGFDRFSSQSLRIGIAELLGIGAKSWKNQADRFDNAAIELGYRNGDSLRKTVRQRVRKRERFIWQECLERLAAQIVAIAVEREFTYQDRLGHRHRKARVMVKRRLHKPTNDERYKIRALMGDELRWIFSQGLATAYRDGLLPHLVRLAVSVVDGGNTELQKLEALFMWAIKESDEDNLWRLSGMHELTGRRQGVAELLGLRIDSYLPFTERERRAVVRLYPAEGKRRREGVGTGLLIAEAISKPLEALAAQEKVLI